MKLAIVLISISLSKFSLVNSCVPEYYWRDYCGVIPKDCYPYGKLCDGSRLYVGQINEGGSLYPGQIRARNKCIYFARNGANKVCYNRDQDGRIKILCTDNPRKLQWIKIRPRHNFELYNIINNRFVRGGFVGNDRTIFVGRRHYKGDLIVGMVDRYANGDTGFWSTHYGRSRRFKKFQILRVR